MAGSSWKIFKTLISKHTNKTPFIYNSNSSSAISSMEKIQDNILQIISPKKYMNFLRQLNESTSSIALKSATPLPDQFVHWWQWYQKLTGAEMIEAAKHQVMLVQDKLFECQDKRRKLTQESMTINEKLKEIYSELVQTKRDDPKYVHLTILENRGLQDQHKINEMLIHVEKEERDHFTHLTTVIKEYHDAQVIYAQKYKYLSIIASTILAFISLTASMIYNNKRIVDVRNVITETQSLMEENINEKLLMIINKIEKQQFNVTSALAVPQLTNSTADSENLNVNNRPELAHHIDDYPFAEIEKLKQTSYYFGIALLGYYVLRQILNT